MPLDGTQPLDERAVATWPVLLRALAIGIALDVGIYKQQPGIGVALFFAVLVVLARGVVRRSVVEDALLVGSAVFGAFVALWASPALAALDVLAAIGMLALASTSHSGKSVVALARKVPEFVLAAVEGPVFLGRPVVRAAARTDVGRARPALRVAAIGVPVLVVFTALLASADRVFGNLVTPNLPRWNAGSFFTQVALTGAGMLCAATLWRAAAQRSDRAEPAAGWSGLARERVGFADWTFVIAGIDVLFAIFVAVQFAVLFGGEHRLRVTRGLTYAEYARSGFFQLIVVAVLTTIVILLTWDFGRIGSARAKRAFRILVTLMIALTGVILASALKRLALYENTYGFTLARFAGYVIIAVTGAFLVGLAALVWTARREHVAVFAIACIAAATLAVNVSNPERFVAERNIARYHATGKIDTAYLGDALGPDAAPAAVGLLPELRGRSAQVLRAALCLRAEELENAPPGWRSGNLGRSRARDALATAGITERACAR